MWGDAWGQATNRVPDVSPGSDISNPHAGRNLELDSARKTGNCWPVIGIMPIDDDSGGILWLLPKISRQIRPEIAV